MKHNQKLIILLFVVVLLLTIPLIAMQFTKEVNWTILDFVSAGLLLLTTSFICEFILRKVTKTKYRIVLCAALLLVFIIVWFELAVGIF